MSNLVLTDFSEGIRTLTLNAPEVRNAYNDEMAISLTNHILADADNPEIRAVILQGAGGHFSAGANLKQQKTLPTPEYMGKHIAEILNPLILAIRNSPKIFIAKIDGNAVGAGLGWALACDLIYASEKASLSAIFSRIGLSPDAGVSWFLCERLGYHKAMELMANARMISGKEAFEMGLVNGVFPDEILDEEVQMIAQNIARGPSVALSGIKANLRAASQQQLLAVLNQERESQMKNAAGSDFLEGVMAFIQKRKANFKGK